MNLNVFVALGLPLFTGGVVVGCGDPGSENFVEEEESPAPVGVGFGSLGASGGIPTAIESTGGGADSFFGEDSGTFEEDGEEDSSSFQSPVEGEGEGALAQGEEDASYAYAYECDPGDEEECVTECGSNGYRVCGKLWGPCIPPDEICNGLDDNCDGEIDEGLTNLCGSCGPEPVEVCNGFDDDCDGEIDEGVTNACGGCGPVPVELCNGVDDNCDGSVDEGLLNACGACGPTNDVEECDGIDNDCDGVVDENCICTINVNFSGDCISTQCPAQCPYPVGCDIQFAGGDPRGCVASKPYQSFVYFQEGNNCGAGSVGGTLICSSVVGQGLTPATCSINKPQPIWASSPGGCPDTD